MAIFSPEKLEALKSQKIHIVGIAGTEGFAIFEFLFNLGCENITGHNLSGGDAMMKAFCAAHVSIPKSERTAVFQRVITKLRLLCTEEDYLKDIESADIIFATQNWFAHSANLPVKKAREKGVPVHFLTQLYFDLSPAPIIAITGTNGKTTVTSLLYHIFQSTLTPSLMSGNDRYHPQVLSDLHTLDPEGALILEVSNRQLLELHTGPAISVLTSIQPDHVDEHGSFRNYLLTKRRLFELTPKSGTAILNRSDPYYNEMRTNLTSSVLTYGLNQPEKDGDLGIVNQQIVARNGHDFIPMMDIGDLSMPGNHNILNSMAAIAASLKFGIAPKKIAAAIQSFKAVKHRIELLGTIQDSRYVDDIASTNPAATRAALESMERPVIWMCGGDLKGNAADYQQLLGSLKQHVHSIIAFPGKASDLICDLAGDIVPVHHVDHLDGAMNIVHQLLKPGIDLLLSPAGAGFQSRFNSGPTGFRKHFKQRASSVRKLAKEKENQDILDAMKIQLPATALTSFELETCGRVLFKHEYQNPTGSHKDRAAFYQMTKARNNGEKAVIIPSSGNAALAVAAAGRTMGMPVYAFVSPATHPGKLTAMAKYRPGIIITSKPVNRARNAAHRLNYTNLRPSRDPNTIAGFTSLGIEIASQDPDEQITDLFLFCTSGATLLGIAKAFNQLIKFGQRKNLPKLHAVQTGSASEIANHFDTREITNTVTDSQHAGFGGVPGTFLTKPVIDQIQNSQGSGWMMFQDEILNAGEILTRSGIETSAEGHAALAALFRWKAEGGEGLPLVILTGRHYDQSDIPFDTVGENIIRSDKYGEIEAFIKQFHWETS